ncbi:MAG: polysaccharide deacetylase family protein, partial [Candidatus Zixiibacteriota bacterium]
MPVDDSFAFSYLKADTMRNISRVCKTSWLLQITVFLCLSSVVRGQEDPGEGGSAPLLTGKIAITFDDLPVARTYDEQDRRQITESILSALAKHDVEAAGFVIGDNINSDWELLAGWLEGGHVLGSHTFSHHDLHNTRAEIFIEDMIHGASALETFLAGYGQKKRYFRFPYLHRGESREVRERNELLLKDNGHIVAPVSVDTDDYLYNLTM